MFITILRTVWRLAMVVGIIYFASKIVSCGPISDVIIVEEPQTNVTVSTNQIQLNTTNTIEVTTNGLTYYFDAVKSAEYVIWFQDYDSLAVANMADVTITMSPALTNAMVFDSYNNQIIWKSYENQKVYIKVAAKKIGSFKLYVAGYVIGVGYVTNQAASFEIVTNTNSYNTNLVSMLHADTTNSTNGYFVTNLSIANPTNAIDSNKVNVITNSSINFGIPNLTNFVVTNTTNGIRGYFVYESYYPTFCNIDNVDTNAGYSAYSMPDYYRMRATAYLSNFSTNVNYSFSIYSDLQNSTSDVNSWWNNVGVTIFTISSGYYNAVKFTTNIQSVFTISIMTNAVNLIIATNYGTNWL